MPYAPNGNHHAVTLPQTDPNAAKVALVHQMLDRIVDRRLG